MEIGFKRSEGIGGRDYFGLIPKPIVQSLIPISPVARTCVDDPTLSTE